MKLGSKKLSIADVATLLGLFIVVPGWFIVHHLDAERDLKDERREQRMIYLVDAYRVIAAAACRKELYREEQRRFEDAHTVIQLMGTKNQIERLLELRPQGGVTDPKPVLRALRDDIRKELQMSSVEEGLLFWRWTTDGDDGSVCPPRQASDSGG